VLFGAIEPLQAWLRRRSALARRLERSDDPLAELPLSTDEKLLTGQVVLVGYGRVGQRIARALASQGVAFVVAEQNRELVEKLRAQGVPAVSGDAAEPSVLIQAHIVRAAMLVIATPDTLGVRQMVRAARALNPGVEVVVRSHNEEEAALLEREQIGKVFIGEHELAHGIAGHVLARMGRVSAPAN
jgi:CPA2 family monovalent cation:H+ antiporter-2